MNDRQNRRPQIAAETGHIQPDPVAAAKDRLEAALAAGKDDLETRAIFQAALPAAVDVGVRTRRGTAFSRQGLSKIAKRAGIQ